MWVKYNTSKHNVGVFAQFRDYVNSIVTSVRYRPSVLRDEIRAAFSHQRSSSAPEPAFSPLLESPMQNTSLLDQLQDRVDSFRSGDPIDEICICSPFFDRSATALARLVGRLGPSKGWVLTGSGRLSLGQRAVPNIRALNETITFKKATVDGVGRLHIKFYAVRCQERVLVALGSANCTIAGLLKRSEEANSELMAIEVMSASRFISEVMNQLMIRDIEPIFDDKRSEYGITLQPKVRSGVSIVTACKHGPRIEVQYHVTGSTSQVSIIALLADSQRLTVDRKSHTLAVSKVHWTPKCVRLIYCSGDGNANGEMCSPPHWVDDEDCLQETAPISRRSDAISNHLDYPRAFPTAYSNPASGGTRTLEVDFPQLLELQQLDLRIAALTREIDRLPKSITLVERRLATHKDALAQQEALLADIGEQRRLVECKVEGLRLKISRLQKQMNSAPGNERFRSIQNEIQYYRDAIDFEEEEILDKMEEAEVLEKDVAAAQASLKAESATVWADVQAARARIEEDKREKDLRVLQRSSLAGRLRAPVLRKYERIRRSRGVAVAHVAGENCSCCHIRLRPKLLQDLRLQTDGMLCCESCGLILYVPEDEAKGEIAK